jgi:perosamine synthetase
MASLASRDMKLMDDSKPGVVPLFLPYVNDAMRANVADQLQTRWLGQGPGVDAFEEEFRSAALEGHSNPVAVSSGTAALHLAYILALESRGIQQGDGEVIAPVFTCTATNLPWIYLGMEIRWADIEPETMNISLQSIERLIGPKTRAISVVHYGGHPANLAGIRALAADAGIPIIEDAAQALGGRSQGNRIGSDAEFAIFSFQAIKHITTGDGGMLVTNDPELAATARRLRWFGIDRKGKQGGTWENDVTEIGYKYQMTDVSAALGRGGLADLEEILDHRTNLLDRYSHNTKTETRTRILNVQASSDDRHAAWLATIVVEQGDPASLQLALRNAGIEANPVHYRNDRYSIFDGRATGDCPEMDLLDGRYLCLPVHMGVTVGDVDRACEVISGDW